MFKVLEEVKSDFAIQLIYDYLNIVNKELESNKNNKQQKERLKELKKQLLLEIEEIYRGNNEIEQKAIKEYANIVRNYYNTQKE